MTTPAAMAVGALLLLLVEALLLLWSGSARAAADLERAAEKVKPAEPPRITWDHGPGIRDGCACIGCERGRVVLSAWERRQAWNPSTGVVRTKYHVHAIGCGCALCAAMREAVAIREPEADTRRES